jgi:hypothetical protein
MLSCPAGIMVNFCTCCASVGLNSEHTVCKSCYLCDAVQTHQCGKNVVKRVEKLFPAKQMTVECTVTQVSCVLAVTVGDAMRQ